MTYELTAICDACGVRETFRVDSFGKKFVGRPLPRGWTHVHTGGQPGAVTPEIGIACSRACLSMARRITRTPREERQRRPRKEPVTAWEQVHLIGGHTGEYSPR